jgi:hypothetical protein
MTTAYRIICCVLLFCILTTCTKKTDPKEQMVKFLENHNEHNIDRTMDYYTDDAIFVVQGQPPLKGKSAIHRVEVWDSAINSRLQVQDIQVRGDTVIIGKIIERNRWFIAAGILEVEYKPGTFVVFSGKKIKEFRPAQLTDRSAQEISAMFQSFMTWAKKERPDELAQIMADKSFNYDPSKAEDWINLIRDWRQNAK